MELARRLGLDWTYNHPKEVFVEMKLSMFSFDNITWERLEQASVTYPSFVLTNPVLDPYGKIPEFKFSACRAFKAASEAVATAN